MIIALRSIMTSFWAMIRSARRLSVRGDDTRTNGQTDRRGLYDHLSANAWPHKSYLALWIERSDIRVPMNDTGRASRCYHKDAIIKQRCAEKWHRFQLRQYKLSYKLHNTRYAYSLMNNFNILLWIRPTYSLNCVHLFEKLFHIFLNSAVFLHMKRVNQTAFVFSWSNHGWRNCNNVFAWI